MRWRWRLRTALGALGLTLWAVCGVARADVDTLDLGARPNNGVQAADSMPDRSRRIVTGFACEDEIRFLPAFAHAQEHGDAWPATHLMAKAAYASGAHTPALRERVVCRAEENVPADVEELKARWQAVFLQPRIALGDERWFDSAAAWQPVVAAATPAARLRALKLALSSYYVEVFGPACTNAVNVDLSSVFFSLTPACLVAQVRRVVTSKKLGAWAYKDGKVIPRLPGTSGLPCVLAVPWFPLSETEGDWDMGVIEYTRLAHLLYTAKSRAPETAGDADAALDKLNRWVLTLRGGPARELYDLAFSCGNPANSFGTAEDYVQDNDVYNEDVGRTVSGENDSEPSFWKKLWRFLRFVAFAAAIAFAVGALLAGLAGSGLLAGGAAAAAAAAAAVVTIIVVTTVHVGGIEETENHLFMQNSSKYLKNKLMMAELRQGGNRDGFDQVASENEDVREWLLKRMKRIVEDDFVEYNAKPYARLTHQAILNLIDYACDVSWEWGQSTWPPRSSQPQCDAKDGSLVIGAASVYDLSAAKAALGSSEGRRLIPFRRLVEANHQYRGDWNDKGKPRTARQFHDMDGNGDNFIAALMVWTGSTQHGPQGRASRGSMGELMWYATSRYRPHAAILDLAVDKSTPIQQEFQHGGDEYYSSGPRWLLTAGGDTTHEAQGLRLNVLPFGFLGADFNIYWLSPANDKGAGVPTTLMPIGTTARRDTMGSFLRFEGDVEDFGEDEGKPLKSFSDNRCVKDGFACGLRLRIPDAIRDGGCLKDAKGNPQAPSQLKFISSADCPEYQRPGAVGNEFFVAVFEGRCSGCDHETWGFIEVVEARDFQGSWELFRDMLVAANREYLSEWVASDGTKRLTYYSMARKQRYEFEPDDEDFDRDCRACGTVVEGKGSTFRIRNPRLPGQAIVIDFADAMNPKRNGEGGLALANP